MDGFGGVYSQHSLGPSQILLCAVDASHNSGNKNSSCVPGSVSQVSPLGRHKMKPICQSSVSKLLFTTAPFNSAQEAGATQVAMTDEWLPYLLTAKMGAFCDVTWITGWYIEELSQTQEDKRCVPYQYWETKNVSLKAGVKNNGKVPLCSDFLLLHR